MRLLYAVVVLILYRDAAAEQRSSSFPHRRYLQQQSTSCAETRDSFASLNYVFAERFTRKQLSNDTIYNSSYIPALSVNLGEVGYSCYYFLPPNNPAGQTIFTATTENISILGRMAADGSSSTTIDMGFAVANIGLDKGESLLWHSSFPCVHGMAPEDCMACIRSTTAHA